MGGFEGGDGDRVVDDGRIEIVNLWGFAPDVGRRDSKEIESAIFIWPWGGILWDEVFCLELHYIDFWVLGNDFKRYLRIEKVTSKAKEDPIQR